MANKIEFIGAKSYEPTSLRKDRRNGSQPRKLETRFGHIENLCLPRGRRSGITCSAIMGRCRRQDERINQIVSEMFLRGVSTRKAGKISHLLWSSDVSPAEMGRMSINVKSELSRSLDRPIAKRFAYLLIDGVYFKVCRKRVNREAALCAAGITAAIRTVLPYSEHQRCLSHKVANLKAKRPKSEWSLVPN